MNAFVLPFLISLAVVLLFGQRTIDYLRSKKSVQPISPDAPEKHRLKHGTPTMGGLLILAAVSVALVVTATVLDAPHAPALWLVLVTFLGAGAIGYLDDLGKAKKKENKAGLSERAKLALQLLVALIFVGGLWVLRHASPAATELVLNGRAYQLGIFYWPLALLFVMGFSNAVNFADGLDGLASGATLIASVGLGIAAALSPLAGGMTGFYGALAGACAAFLWFNAYPARVFMGDTGSLALGMGLSAAAILAKQELLVLVIGAVYLAEIGSMMIQRYVFKYRRIKYGLEFAQKNRVFRRAPLHHHFEELGWHETQVVGRFYVIALIAAAIGLVLAPYISVTGAR